MGLYILAPYEFSQISSRLRILPVYTFKTTSKKQRKAKDKQDAKENDTFTPTRAILDNVRDSIKNKKLEREPEKQLEMARKILRRIDTESSHLRSTKAKDVFKEVYKLVTGIKNALEK